jgi:hypothetical protein
MTASAVTTDDTNEQAQSEGKLFALPAIDIDDSNPTVIKIAVSGSIEIDRANASDVAFYNSLKAGKMRDLLLEVHVGSTKTTHRRDSEGDVDAVVQTKSLVVTGVSSEEASA